jgi:uncharacterized coiled-coil protein SlyX
MTSESDRIAELEKKFAFFESCYHEQIRYLTWHICDLEHRLNQLASVHPDLQAIEKLVFDAHTASNDQVQDTLVNIDRIVPLNMPELDFARLPTVREARRRT